ncbi:autophagy protein 5, putative [Plasmodium chabaudi adami]|uniref:Autophagy protein 5 n=1 Tax=Plasmodium chabaudi adami TaxID=5826 RepID=A0A1C6XQ66_PLACE|nr:autophagy protein 5, putative [Plasmodium chabaudi adami]
MHTQTYSNKWKNMKEYNKILSLEKPDIDQINNNIENSKLVLCICISENESVSLIPPSYYYIHVHRYMYLSNIIPKCLEYFKSFILPFYGNQFGVYFECIGKSEKKENKKQINSNDNGYNTDSNINKNDDVNNLDDYISEEKIILDWRLPIGVLFDIYCDIDDEDDYFMNSQVKTNKNWKFCSNNELFYEHVNILKVQEDKSNDVNSIESSLNKDLGEFSTNLKPKEDENDDNVTANISNNNNNNQKDSDKGSHNTLIEKKNIINKAEQDIIDCKSDEKLNEVNEKNSEDENLKGCSHELFKPLLEFDRRSNSNANECVNPKNDNYKYYSLIGRKEINNDWYEKKFRQISYKNIPWKLILNFKGKEEYYAHMKNRENLNNTSNTKYNSCIPLYRGVKDFEDYIINELKKSNYILNKNNRLLHTLPRKTEEQLLQNLTNFNVKKICPLYRECIDYNMIIFLENFYSEYIKPWEIEKLEKSKIDDKLDNEEQEKGMNKIRNTEKIIKEAPIIIHIYGPPYNKIQTKFPLFKVTYSKYNENRIEEIVAYTLGDFLHVNFPTFVRKIKKNEKASQKNGEKGSQKNDEKGSEKASDKTSSLNQSNDDDTNNANLKREFPENKETNPDDKEDIDRIPLKGQNIFYHIEDEYIIFCPYMFIIINGIQIPLKSPLYWLFSNFSHFDNFLHIILRIPPY